MQPGTARPTRVCFRVDNPFTHDARVRREAEALAEAGYEVTVYADARPELPDEERMGDLEIRRIRKSSSIPYWSIVKPLLAERADVYHAHDIDSLFPCLAAAALGRRGARVIYDSHELWRNQAGDKMHAKRQLLVRLEGSMLRHAEGLITASPAYTEAMVRRYRFTGPAVTVLNVPDYRDDEELAEAWAERDASQEIRIAAMGVFQFGRGAVPLIQSLEHLPDHYVVEFIGPVPQPEYEAAMREAAAPFGQRVRMIGRIPADRIVPRLAAAHVSTALIEPISESYRLTAPNKVFESMMAGTPLVASDMPTIAAFVRETGAGIVCDVADPRSVAEAIRAAVDGQEEYRRRAREAAKLYNWSSQKHTLIDLYSHVLA